MSTRANRFSLIVKQDCPTCQLVLPAVHQLAAELGESLVVYCQDDPTFPPGVEAVKDDRKLEYSFLNRIETVPTLIAFDARDRELARTEGWDRSAWQTLTEQPSLGEKLPPFKPGCGSKSVAPGIEEQLALRFAEVRFQARQVEPAESEDIMEACFERGWSDGLPVVPPTPLRVLRMLRGSDRDPGSLIGDIPPNNVPCSVEKAAINAVLAGCKPDYFPTVLASIEAALQDAFCMHGLLCTTYFSAPVVIVNGPVSRQIGMNSGVNALGQGNRANATIGRALQLLIRNVGGGLPGGIDRATLGNPGKYTYCFAEDESEVDWQSLAQDRGFERSDSVVSLFAGEGLQPIMDQLSRSPESLARSMAASLRSVAHVKRYSMADAILIVCPEHRRLFKDHGWSKEDLRRALFDELMISGAQLLPGVGGMAEGMPEKFKDKLLNKFRDDGLHIVTAGGTAGMFSAIISGWVAAGERGSQLVSQLIKSNHY